ncbi:MAG: spermidine synthase [Planctomycetes bacterium]|nr:spermidine synthase [Planctomycetota bacterium]
MASERFQELDWAATELGELVLRRRRTVATGDDWVYEVKLADRFLMSSLNTASERELATRALARLSGDGLRVLVGGLGLGYTAAAALQDPRVACVDVVERLPQVVAWHRRGLVPLGAALCADARCRFVLGDCLQQLQEPGDTYDAILVDIDDSPIHLLDEGHAPFYAIAGLKKARRRLRAGGVFALWTSLPAEPEVQARFAAAFATADCETVSFDNPLLEEPEANALYFGRA